MFRPGHKKLTPVMRQYRDAKEAYPDAILFFRLGDFYEMFNDDAVVAARALSLTLTSRNKGAAEQVPMAGIPYHAAHNYLSRLIALGHKVAICEQIGDPSKIKGIVPRKVVRVLTPSLLTDSGQLDARKNNFLCAVDGSPEDEQLGIALLDFSTGELTACSIEGSAMLIAELARAEPSETLLPEELEKLSTSLEAAIPSTTIRIDRTLDDAEVRKHLDEKVEQPLYEDAVGQHQPAALRAASRVLRFATHYLPETTIPVRRIGRLDAESWLQIDETAQSHLELVRGAGGSRAGSLLEVIDQTVTASGARLIRRQLLRPLMDVAHIRRRLDAVGLFVHNPKTREELRLALRNVGDIERLAIRASLREATPRDLGNLRDSLEAAPQALAAIRTIAATTTDHGGAGQVLELDVDLLAPLQQLLANALVDQPPATSRDGGIFRSGHDEQLDGLEQIRREGSSLITRFEQRLRDETSIPSLKVKYTRAFGWYIEVTRAQLDKVPPNWRRRQTLTAAERYLDDELEELADSLAHAEERHGERERELYKALLEEVAGQADALRTLGGAVAQWDVSSALAETAHSHDLCRPEVDDGDVLHFVEARHPVVERYVERGSFVPNDTLLDLNGGRLWLITGPNMAGKSTLMRQVALNTVLAQMGSFVAAKSARLGLVDRVLSRVGASDNLAQGESTFMVEMRETAAILRNASRRSLVILDEIGRGTSTYDGLAIAWAVAEHLQAIVGCRAMFATHYHQLTELASDRPAVANYSVSARQHEGELVFLHRLTPGAVSRSYGIAVARLAGLPESVLHRAQQVLESLESETALPGGPGQSGGAASQPQLALFDAAPTCPATSAGETKALAELRSLDINKLTPLAALQLLDDLQRGLDN